MSRVCDWVVGDICRGDLLISVNGIRTQLETYVRSTEALSMLEWTLILEIPAVVQPPQVPAHFESVSISSLDFSLYSGKISSNY